MLVITGTIKNPNLPNMEVKNPHLRITPIFLPFGKLKVDIQAFIGKNILFSYSKDIDANSLQYLKSEANLYTAVIKSIENLLILELQNNNPSITITQL
jgi:hypothetical protein